MIKYESLKTTHLNQAVCLPTNELPELVHLDDPAHTVMNDFKQIPPHTIEADESMDAALNKMKSSGVHMLLVKDAEQHIIGVLGSENILGEAPIKIIEERRIERSQVLVKMLMTPITKLISFTMADLSHAKVGHIATTLRDHHTHYALVIDAADEDEQPIRLRGIFSASQISHQLHMDISKAIDHKHTP